MEKIIQNNHIVSKINLYQSTPASPFTISYFMSVRPFVRRTVVTLQHFITLRRASDASSQHNLSHKSMLIFEKSIWSRITDFTLYYLLIMRCLKCAPIYSKQLIALLLLSFPALLTIKGLNFYVKTTPGQKKKKMKENCHTFQDSVEKFFHRKMACIFRL